MGNEVKESIPKGMIKAVGGAYKCVKKCYFGVTLYEEGALYHSTKGEFIPKHFVKVSKHELKED